MQYLTKKELLLKKKIKNPVFNFPEDHHFNAASFLSAFSHRIQDRKRTSKIALYNKKDKTQNPQLRSTASVFKMMNLYNFYSYYIENYFEPSFVESFVTSIEDQYKSFFKNESKHWFFKFFLNKKKHKQKFILYLLGLIFRHPTMKNNFHKMVSTQISATLARHKLKGTSQMNLHMQMSRLMKGNVSLELMMSKMIDKNLGTFLNSLDFKIIKSLNKEFMIGDGSVLLFDIDGKLMKNKIPDITRIVYIIVPISLSQVVLLSSRKIRAQVAPDEVVDFLNYCQYEQADKEFIFKEYPSNYNKKWTVFQLFPFLSKKYDDTLIRNWVNPLNGNKEWLNSYKSFSKNIIITTLQGFQINPKHLNSHFNKQVKHLVNKLEIFRKHSRSSYIISVYDLRNNTNTKTTMTNKDFLKIKSDIKQ